MKFRFITPPAAFLVVLVLIALPSLAQGKRRYLQMDDDSFDVLTTCPNEMPNTNEMLECDSVQLQRNCLYDPITCDGHGGLVFGYDNVCTCQKNTDDPNHDYDILICSPVTDNDDCPIPPNGGDAVDTDNKLVSCPNIIPILDEESNECDADVLREDCVYDPVTCEGHGNLAFGYNYICTCMIDATSDETTLQCASVTVNCPETNENSSGVNGDGENDDDDVLTDCPIEMPALGETRCDSTELTRNCLYHQITCEGHGGLVFGYDHTCMCVDSSTEPNLDVDTLICAPRTNNDDCPPPPAEAAVSDDNKLLTCPTVMPSFNEEAMECDVAVLREDCVFDPVTCEGHGDLVFGYGHICSCMIDATSDKTTLQCASVTVNCPETNENSSGTDSNNGNNDVLADCPTEMPELDKMTRCDSTELTRDCLYHQISCEGHGGLVFGYEHTCMCDVDTLICAPRNNDDCPPPPAEAAVSDDNKLLACPNNLPPLGQDDMECDASVLREDCVYGPVTCDKHADLVYGYEYICSCMMDATSSKTTLQCGPVIVNCPTTQQVTNDDSSQNNSNNANDNNIDILTTCPGTMPSLENTLECDSVQLTRDCLYNQVKCEGHGELIFGYRHTCSCLDGTENPMVDMDTFLCASTTVQCPQPPSTNGNIADDVLTSCPGALPDFVVASPDCNADELREDCVYGPVTCEGHGNLVFGYEHICTCFDSGDNSINDKLNCSPIQRQCPSPPSNNNGDETNDSMMDDDMEEDDDFTDFVVPSLAITNPPNLIPIGNVITPTFAPKPSSSFGGVATSKPGVTTFDASPDNPPACPLKKPEIGTICDAGQMTDNCKYSGIMCEGYDKPQGYEHFCNCEASEFICASALVICPDPPLTGGSEPVPSTVTTNPPNMIPIGDVVTPTFAPKPPKPVPTVNGQASPDNHMGCPAKEPDPSLAQSCDITKSDCKYSPFVCPGYEDFVGYIASCSCMDEGGATGVLRCAQALVECPEPPKSENENSKDFTFVSTCPQRKPEDGADCSFQGLNSSCRYTPTNCPDSEEIDFENNCICAAGHFTCVAQVDAECHNAVMPQCPINNPDGQSEECNIDLSTICGYNPAGCPGSSDPGVFLTKCKCVDGEFDCVNSQPLDCLGNEISIQEGDEPSGKTEMEVVKASSNASIASIVRALIGIIAGSALIFF